MEPLVELSFTLRKGTGNATMLRGVMDLCVTAPLGDMPNDEPANLAYIPLVDGAFPLGYVCVRVNREDEHTQKYVAQQKRPLILHVYESYMIDGARRLHALYWSEGARRAALAFIACFKHGGRIYYRPLCRDVVVLIARLVYASRGERSAWYDANEWAVGRRAYTATQLNDH